MKQNETNFTPKSAELRQCIKCDFTCSKNIDWERHILTAKHINTKNTNDFTPKSAKLRQCIKCDVVCSKNIDWQRHIATAKHINTKNTNDFTPNKKYSCVCEKTYIHASSLWNHKKKCVKLIEEKNIQPISELSK